MNSISKLAIMFSVAILIASTDGSVLSGQDTLVIRTNEKTSKRQGMIVDWKGTTIFFESNGRTKEYDSTTVIEVDTVWPSEYLEGLELFRKRQFKQAIVAFQDAVKSEKREWAQTEISGKLIECYLATQNKPTAVGEFLRIVNRDPQTRFFHLIPIPWTNSGEHPSFANRAVVLMKSSDLTEQLIGAAWSLSTIHRQEAIAKLEELSRDINPNIVAVAMTQIWRTQSVTATEKDIVRWERNIQSMPIELRAGAYWQLADVQSRKGQTDSAAINLMRIPIVYSTQHDLAAAALYQCATLRQNANKLAEYKSLLNEVQRDYTGTIWASQAKAQLNQLNKN